MYNLINHKISYILTIICVNKDNTHIKNKIYVYLKIDGMVKKRVL